MGHVPAFDEDEILIESGGLEEYPVNMGELPVPVAGEADLDDFRHLQSVRGRVSNIEQIRASKNTARAK